MKGNFKIFKRSREEGGRNKNVSGEKCQEKNNRGEVYLVSTISRIFERVKDC